MAVETGGFIDTPNQRFAISHRERRDLRAGPGTDRRARARRRVVRIGDVAHVTEGFPPPIGDAIINNVPGLLLIVEKQLGANTLEVTRGVDEALAHLAPALGDVEVDARIFRPATFIEASLGNLNRALLFGCVLVVIVLIVFLADWRTALISSIAIPLSLLAAGVLLRYRGGTLDTMVLAGLVIALGEVVDDAIIDVENIVRRLRLNRRPPAPRPALVVVLDASLEVRSAVVYGSLIVVAVFLPVFMLDGLSGAFFRPLAISYVLAIFASLLVALTITPALSLLLLPKRRARRPSRGSWPAQATATAACCCELIDRTARRCRHACSRTAGRHRRRVSVPRRGVPAELPRIRLPDALGREARRVGRSEPADYRTGQQGAAGDPRRAQLRIAHRPR